MSRLKNLSRGGYIVIGIIATLILVPTGIAAAATVYNGIAGTNGTTATVNDAHVTSAGQLTTTEAAPTNYRSFVGDVLAPGDNCVAISPALPSGFAFDVQNVSVAILASTAQTTSGSANQFGSDVTIEAATPSRSPCLSTKNFGALIGIAVAPDGNTGNVDLPQPPGFVVPNGYQIYARGLGITNQAVVKADGYLIPSSDAPSTPG